MIALEASGGGDEAEGAAAEPTRAMTALRAVLLLCKFKAMRRVAANVARVVPKVAAREMAWHKKEFLSSHPEQ